MKRFICLVLLVCMVITVFTGCESLFHLYRVEVTGSKNDLASPISPFCQAGKTIEIKTYSIMDASIYVFVNGEEISMSRYDSGYWYFEFVMPEENVTIHLTHDPFYGRDEYEFSELIYWAEHLKNGIGGKPISKVSVKIENYADKTAFVETRYSSKQEDIDSFIAITNQKLIKVDRDTVTDSDYRNTYTFFCEDNPYTGDWVGELIFYGEIYNHYYNETSFPQTFRFEDPDYLMPTIDDPDLVTYSFKYDGRSSDIKKYGDDAYSKAYYHIGLVEFVPYEGEEINIEPTYYLDSRYGTINLLTSTIFELNGEYYEIVSGEGYWAYNYCQLDIK